VAFPKFKSFTWIGAGLGALGPLLYYLSPACADYILGDGFWVWPTGIVIMISYGHEHDLFGYIVIAISILMNMCVYALAGAIVGMIVAKIRPSAKPAP
jgi:hypothetical protein